MTPLDASGRPRVSAGVAGAIVLLVLYIMTLAPSVTFWDAGEFIAAAHSLGIPHPPGTPLFILLVNAWAKLLAFLPYAAATNLFSAAVTALAAGICGHLVQRATGDGLMAFAATLVAGTMSSVWLNATETEVYAASLALGVLMIWAGDRAGRGYGERWTCLTVYLIALAVPLHLSALVATPAAIALAAMTPEGIRWRRVTLLGGALLLAMGAGRVSSTLCGVGAAVMLASLIPAIAARLEPGRPADARWLPIASLLVVAVATSALAFLIVRARLDPAINQGNPDSWRALTDVIARRQYAVSPLWPRMAPPWLQLANFGQYADWQVALSTGPTVMPSILRTLGTFVFLYFGYHGAIAHWKADRRTAIGLGVLLLCGSVGVLVYLNLHAGPSILYGILPPNVTREARERDYFFVFAFWVWGLWSGIGAVWLWRRWTRPAWSGALVALLPLILNWRAVTRRGEPEQSLPRHVATALLESTPANGVLFVMGDNDSYPLWFAQRVSGTRRDVAVITVPLLPTRWYRAEIARRHGLLAENEVERYEGRLPAAAAVGEGARRANRPLVAAVTMTPGERERLAKTWTAHGLVFVANDSPAASAPVRIDTVAVRTWTEWVDRRIPSRETRPAIDPVNSYFRRVLDCPSALLSLAQTGDTTRLDSVCNYR